MQKGETFANATFLVQFDKESTHFECVGQNLRSLLHINGKKWKFQVKMGWTKHLKTWKNQ